MRNVRRCAEKSALSVKVRATSPIERDHRSGASKGITAQARAGKEHRSSASGKGMNAQARAGCTHLPCSPAHPHLPTCARSPAHPQTCSPSNTLTLKHAHLQTCPPPFFLSSPRKRGPSAIRKHTRGGQRSTRTPSNKNHLSDQEITTTQPRPKILPYKGRCPAGAEG